MRQNRVFLVILKWRINHSYIPTPMILAHYYQKCHKIAKTMRTSLNMLDMYIHQSRASENAREY